MVLNIKNLMIININRLEYMIYCDGFDYMILIAEWAKGEKTALLKIEKMRRYKLYDIENYQT